MPYIHGNYHLRNTAIAFQFNGIICYSKNLSPDPFFFTVTFRFEQIAKDFAKAPCNQLDLRAILLQLFTKLRYITAVQLRDANQLSFNVPMPEV